MHFKDILLLLLASVLYLSTSTLSQDNDDNPVEQGDTVNGDSLVIDDPDDLDDNEDDGVGDALEKRRGKLPGHKLKNRGRRDMSAADVDFGYIREKKVAAEVAAADEGRNWNSGGDESVLRRSKRKTRGKIKKQGKLKNSKRG